MSSPDVGSTPGLHHTAPAGAALAGDEHVVQFYDADAFVRGAIARFVADGLVAGDPVIVVATEPHRAACIERLAAAGHDVSVALGSGQLAMADAHEMIESVFVDGAPDQTRFSAIVEGMIAGIAAERPGACIRMYGEMVDVLSRRGDTEAALRLEHMWNRVQGKYRVRAMCAYAMDCFGAHGDATALHAVCDAHSRVIPTEAYCDVPDEAARVREIALLQQRARALESEVSRRRESEKALRDAVERLERSEDALRATDRRKDEFLAMLAHELRNPLAPILNGVQLLRQGGRRGDRTVDTIERQAKHLARLVDDLLDVSRVTLGKIDLERHPVDLAKVLGGAVEVTRGMFDQRSQTVSVDARRGLVVHADEVRLAQVFANILANAAQYTGRGGHVQVEASRDRGDVAVSFKDDGMGIERDMLDHVFELFVQSPRALDRSQGGLGVGLTTARAIVELHGGTVVADSAGVGKGSEFVVRLPAIASSAPAASEGHADRAAVGAGALRVLVVDDNRDAAELLSEALRSAGHEVAVAADGAQALSMARGLEPDLVVLDIGLPVIDGYEVARTLRRSLPRPPRLIALSGYGQDSDRERSRDAGFEVHLVKPVDLETFLALVAA